MSFEKLTIRKTATRRSRERGSALLIVFVFAAMLAIMLYMELPVAAFEAQRNRERLVIDHGNEYARAVKLFFRKFGRYPASVQQLENTNNMRFLRQRYKDPLTGKEDWRQLHAGPNGQLIDSKVNPITNTPNGSSSNSSGSSTGTGTFGSSSSTANSSFANSSFGSSASNSNSNSGPTEIVTSSLPQRGPAVSASGSEPGSNLPPGDQNLMTPLLAPSQSAAAVQSGPASSAPAGQLAAQPGQTGTSNALPGTVLPGNGQPGVSPGDTNGMQTVQNMLNNPNSPPPPGGVQQASSSPAQASSSTAMGVINSGGFAGVASIAHGQSIKTVNDQSDYSLWEFYYDPTKDATRGLAAAAQALGGQAAQPVAQPAGTISNPQSPYAGPPPTPVAPPAPSPNPPQN